MVSPYGQRMHPRRVRGSIALANSAPGAFLKATWAEGNALKS
jgi:hypothetical protein